MYTTFLGFDDAAMGRRVLIYRAAQAGDSADNALLEESLAGHAEVDVRSATPPYIAMLQARRAPTLFRWVESTPPMLDACALHDFTARGLSFRRREAELMGISRCHNYRRVPRLLLIAGSKSCFHRA